MRAPNGQRSAANIERAGPHIRSANLLNRRNLCGSYIVHDAKRADHCRGKSNAAKINVATQDWNEIDKVWITSKWCEGEETIKKNGNQRDGNKAPPDSQYRCSCAAIEPFGDHDG